MKHRIIGIIGTAFGLSGFLPLFMRDVNTLIVPASQNPLVKYCIVILLINGGLLFLTAGILVLKGTYLPADEHVNPRITLFL